METSTHSPPKRKAKVWTGIYWLINIGAVFLTLGYFWQWLGWDELLSGRVSENIVSGLYWLGFIAAGLIFLGVGLIQITLDQGD